LVDAIRTALALVALALVALALAGCGPETEASPPRPASPTAYESRGVAVKLPFGWQHSSSSLTPGLTDPREVMSVGTFALRFRPTSCAHIAGSALEDLGPGDAFVTLLERGLEPGSSWAGFPPRPAQFGPELGGPSEASECVPTADLVDHWFGFTDGDRHFHVLVAFGPQTTAATRAEAWSILDGLRVDPSVRPDWQSAG
jgi:hypothetical protein